MKRFLKENLKAHKRLSFHCLDSFSIYLIKGRLTQKMKRDISSNIKMDNEQKKKGNGNFFFILDISSCQVSDDVTDN